MSPAELYAGADRVVEGTVIETRVRWDDQHRGLETVATISTGSSTVEFVVPGGTLDGVRQVMFGTPAITLGERARWFLRDRGDGKLGVYGWAQGKWPAIGNTYEPVGIAAELGIAEFATNGMVWPASTMPVPYFVNSAGSADIPRPQVIAAINAAFATWQAVPCATLTFRNAGLTNRTVNTDGRNVILFIESNWIYGTEAAAATALWIVDGQQTADIAMNGVNFTWAIGPANSLVTTGKLDLQAVLTHEIGHFSGLGHSDRAYDTMYYSWKPWQGQRTLSIDDKLGLCSIYPTIGNECPMPACPTEETCTSLFEGQLCAGEPDPIGAPCNYDRVECGAFCLFTAIDLSTGYCSKFCASDADCPLTHHCADASAGSEIVKVCFEGAQPPHPEPDPECVDDSGCPAGQFCDATRNACTFDCRTDADCASGSCNERGACEDRFVVGGGGCQSHDASIAGFIVIAIGLLLRRRGAR